MARIRSNGQIQGMVGNLTCRVFNGKNIMQVKAKNIKQTPATKRNASQFGKVSSLAKTLRLPIQYAIGENQDGGMHRRLTTVLVNCMNQNKRIAIDKRNLLNTDLSSLVGFELNNHAALAKYCNLPLNFEFNANKKLVVSMPTIEVTSFITFPENTKELNIQIICTRTGFALTSEAHTTSYSLPIYRDTAEIEAFAWEALEQKKDETIVVTVQMWCVRNDASQERQLLNCKTFNPSAVVYVDNGV